MPIPEIPFDDPITVSAEGWTIPEEADLRFEGFEREAFDTLARLRERPHIDQYRVEKEGIARYLTEPYKRYRDDLVVHWVLPNRLAFETQKNVFSRLLKNDFGGGGSHQHLWMAFYRPGLRRLTDYQLSHRIDPDGFAVGLFAGAYAVGPLRQALRAIEAQPETFLAIVAPLAARDDWTFQYSRTPGKSGSRKLASKDPEQLLDELSGCRGLWLRRTLPRDDVVRLRGELVRWSIETLRMLWPLYRFYGRDA